MTKRFEMPDTERPAELASFAAGDPPTERFEPAPAWGAPGWGEARPRPEGEVAGAGGPAYTAPVDRDALGDGDALGDVPADDDEPFVPAPRYRMGRLTKVLVCICLVLAGALGGAAIQKAVDVRSGTTGRANFSQFAPGTGQTGAGTGFGSGGFGGRNRATAPASSGGN